tara:strand:+ start:161 stop:592 length:432 start_codon:yes stop_codon:yes gene_type:complete
MSNIVRHPHTQQLRREFVRPKEREKAEKREKRNKDRQAMKKYQKKLSNKLAWTLAGLGAAAALLGQDIPHLFQNTNPKCLAPPTHPVAGHYPPAPATCGPDDELKELRKLEALLNLAEEEMKALTKYKRSTFVDKVKAATKDS